MSEIDFDRVVTLLHLADVPAYVEQTGGGCATIQAGPTVIDRHGDTVYAALCGPGYFAGPGWTLGRGDTADLCVGPDDQGESEYWVAPLDADEQTIAERIVQQVKASLLTRSA